VRRSFSEDKLKVTTNLTFGSASRLIPSNY